MGLDVHVADIVATEAMVGAKSLCPHLTPTTTPTPSAPNIINQHYVLHLSYMHMSIQHTAVVLYSPSGLAWPTCHMRDTCVRLDRVYGMCSKSIFGTATMILLLIFFSLIFHILHIYICGAMYVFMLIESSKHILQTDLCCLSITV